MGDSDLWRADGSFRGIQSSGGGKGKGGGKGSGPQFTRVIPKFLQKFHEPPAIQAKFAPTMPVNSDEEEQEEELDDVQKAAIAEFLEKDHAKKGGGEGSGSNSTELAASETKPKKTTQSVAGVGGGGRAQQQAKSKQEKGETKKKRKRPDAATLSNKKLLSFSMDDDE